jgi:hypothetical protein
MTIDSIDLIKPAVLLKNGDSVVVFEIAWESDVEQFPGFERQGITALGQWPDELLDSGKLTSLSNADISAS